MSIREMKKGFIKEKKWWERVCTGGRIYWSNVGEEKKQIN